VRDASRGGALLGSALVHVAAAKDGTTLLWACDRDGRPLATRWGGGDAPWRLALPLEDCETAGELVLGLSVDPWSYRTPAGGAAALVRSAGPRSVVLQVMEGRNLPAKDWCARA